MTSLYTDQTNIKGNNIFVRQALPDVTTLAEKFRQEGYNSVRIGKIYHYSNPGHIGTSSFDDPDSWDYVINPHGRDKKEEHKINGIVDDWGGGDLSWLASSGLRRASAKVRLFLCTLWASNAKRKLSKMPTISQ